MNFVNVTRESTTSKDLTCPFLGLKDDSSTSLSFPSSGNHCFHAKPVLPITLGFQETHCLSSNHTNCEEFVRNPGNPLLPSLRFENSSRMLLNRNKIISWIILLGTVIIVLIVWQVFARGLLGFGHPGLVSGSPIAISSPTTGLLTLANSPTQTQNTPIPTIMMTATTTLPILTATPTKSLPHALETPIGLEHKLIIHRVMLGESLPSIATLFSTTVEAIQSINYRLPLPLMVDWLIVVPVGQVDVHELPAFVAYDVEADVVVETLAQQLSVDPKQLKLYNGFRDGELVSSGDWLLIPHLGTPTP